MLKRLWETLTQSEIMSSVYVIGGIADKNQMKNESLKRAQQLKVRTVRFPLESYFPNNKNKGLNVAQCCLIRLFFVVALVSWKELERSVGSCFVKLKWCE